MISDKNLARLAVFLSDAMKLLHTCGSGTFHPSMILRIGFFFPTRFDLVTALIVCCNSCCVTSDVTCHVVHEHISIVAKRLTPMRFSKSLDQAMTVNQHTHLHVGFWICRGYVNRILISSDFCIEFMSPPCLARDSGIGVSSCFRIVPISTVRPAVTPLSNRCRSILLALTIFCTLCLVDRDILYRVATVFERCFLSTS